MCSCVGGDNNFNQNSLSNSIRNVYPIRTSKCPSTVHEVICVKADVTITPAVSVGEVDAYCIGLPVIGMCPGTRSDECTFRVSQFVCVQIPLTFTTDVLATPAGIVCSNPEVGPCPSTTSCTYTIGYYRNHLQFTKDLITIAGGTIILGIDRMGLSFTVTAANAKDVLSLNTPSPPSPDSSPFHVQYQNLYAQLLVSNLNIINRATCDYATAAINSANIFLANSPIGGMSGAPSVQAPLAKYNEGTAPGCPAHCPSELD